jgi:hypothetical protein
MIRVEIGYGEAERPASYRYFPDVDNANAAVEIILERALDMLHREFGDIENFDYGYDDIWSVIVDRFEVKDGEYKRVERIARYDYNYDKNEFEKEEV